MTLFIGRISGIFQAQKMVKMGLGLLSTRKLDPASVRLATAKRSVRDDGKKLRGEREGGDVSAPTHASGLDCRVGLTASSQ
jgi:hypothetical protein